MEHSGILCIAGNNNQTSSQTYDTAYIDTDEKSPFVYDNRANSLSQHFATNTNHLFNWLSCNDFRVYTSEFLLLPNIRENKKN